MDLGLINGGTDALRIDLPRLLETRMLVQANSGGGKSWVLRRLLEQTARDVQQIVIDPEGEFATLREQFDYVIAAPRDADVVANPATAALLARRLLETGVSAIVDIYDLKAADRQVFVARFLHALVNAPRALWHPVLLVIDEAHVFCPQAGKADAAAAVIDVCTRGRKRGLCPVLATQRLSKLHKDAAAEMLNKLIGRTGLDVDVKRAADELGLSTAVATQQLRALQPGAFYAYGPALCNDVARVDIGAVVTTHPQSGHRLMQAPPAPTARVRASLAKLADLQAEADQEAQDVESLRAANARLIRERDAANRAAKNAGVPEAEVLRRIDVAVSEARAEPTTAAVGGVAAATIEGIAACAAAARALSGALDALDALDALQAGAPITAMPKARAAAQPAARDTARPAAVARQPAPSGGLTGPEQRILNALAWMNAIGVDQPEQTAVAFLAGYTIGGGAWNNPRGALRTKGLIEYAGQQLRLTDAGAQLAQAPDVQPGNAALHDAIRARLPGPETKLLNVLLDAYPSALTNEALATAAGYTPGGGAYNNPRGRLRSLGLVEYAGGMVKARSILFPESSNG